jgi:hypothetical protein
VVNGDGFERWLEQELQQTAREGGPSPAPSQAGYHAANVQGGLHMSGLATAASVISAKGAVGLAVAVLAAGAAGEAVVTGSVNPSNWGQQVVVQVQTCKDALTGDEHGIGDCVSTFAKQNGPAVSGDHRASGARTNHPSATDHPGGQPTGNPNATSHPTGPPTTRP